MSLEPPTQHDRHVLANARVVTPTRVIEGGHLVIEGDRIAHVGGGPAASPDAGTDLRGRLVMPGIVDLHGDDLERYVSPRPEARVDTDLALLECDRGNAAAGITTKFHAIAVECAPEKDRSVGTAKRRAAAVGASTDTLMDNRVHLRCELSDPAAVATVMDALDRDAVGLVSLMNHRPDHGQFSDVEAFSRHYGDGGPVVRDESSELIARRGDVSADELLDRASRIAAAARRDGVPVASHDDQDSAWIDRMAECGVSISEYPVEMAAARRATDHGMTTAMGAPNLLRGGSLWGNLSARAAIEADAVDALVSDFHPASMLASVFVETGESLVDRVARVTRVPATTAGLSDRGRIEPGARADLLVVNPRVPPRVERVFVAGREVFRALG